MSSIPLSRILQTKKTNGELEKEQFDKQMVNNSSFFPQQKNHHMHLLPNGSRVRNVFVFSYKNSVLSGNASFFSISTESRLNESMNAGVNVYIYFSVFLKFLYIDSMHFG